MRKSLIVSAFFLFHIFPFCFSAFGQNKGDFLKEELNLQIERFYNTVQGMAEKDSIKDRIVMVNVVNFDSSDLLSSDWMSIKILTDSVAIVYTEINWIPPFDAGYVRDRMDILYIRKVWLDESTYNIVFIWNEIQVIDKVTLDYRVYLNNTLCFPSVLVSN